VKELTPILPFTKKVKKALGEAVYKDIVISKDIPAPNGKFYSLKIEFREVNDITMCHVVLFLEKNVVLKQDVLDFASDCERIFSQKEFKMLIQD
jgi:hypothetical protein